MSVEQIVFLLFALAAVLGALGVAASRNLVRAAFSLIGCLFAVAGLFALLDIGLLAVAQVAVYIGAIATIIVLAVMLTRRDLRDARPLHGYWPVAGIAALLVVAGIAWAVLGIPAGLAAPTALPAGDLVTEVGRALADPAQFALVFEGSSVLLLAALIGAVLVAGGSRGEEQAPGETSTKIPREES